MSAWVVLSAIIASDPAPFMDGRVVAHDPGPVEAGATFHLSLTIVDEPDRTMPLLVWVSADEGLQLVENRWTWVHVVDPDAVQPRLQGRVRVSGTPGRYRAAALLTYGTCSLDRCRQRFASAAWVVEVVGSTSENPPAGPDHGE